MDKEQKKQVSFKVNLETLEKLDMAVRNSGMSRSALIAKIISEYFDNTNKIIKINTVSEVEHSPFCNEKTGVVDMQKCRLEKVADKLDANWGTNKSEELENEYLTLLREKMRKEKENGKN